MSKTNNIFKTIFLFVFSLIVASFVSEKNGINFLLGLPNILGILLGGILASLAIIFGLLSSQELAVIHKRSMKSRHGDIYSEFLKNTKLDTIIIFSSLCLSIIITLVYDFDLRFINIPFQEIINLSTIQILAGFGLFILLFSLSAIYDIIMSLFYLNQLRYELSKSDDISEGEDE